MMRGLIDKDKAFHAVDERIEELSKDPQFNYGQQICVSGVKDYIAAIPVKTEQEIVKPYLDKISKELEKLIDDNLDIDENGMSIPNQYAYCYLEIADFIDDLVKESEE